MTRTTRKLALVALFALIMSLIIGGSQAQETDMETIAQGNTTFAFELFDTILNDDGLANDNLIFSPYSISQALAMVYIGADGDTQSQMQSTLNITLPQEQVGPAFSELNTNITTRPAVDESENERLQINVANAIWGQQEFPFLQDYIDTINDNFGAGLQLTDFRNAPGDARDAINEWAAEQTQDRIQEVIPEGAITPQTRMVLANAIYFLASWANPFMEGGTQDAPFTLLNGDEVTVPMMRQSELMLYAQGDGFQVVDLPYFGGDAGMIIMLPESGSFETFRETLNAEQFNGIVEQLMPAQVVVTLPRWEYDTEIQLSQVLAEMGMPVAFSNNADFSGIAEEPLAIDEVIHKAFVAVDEEGTEAAAVTAITMRATSAPSEIFEFNADRPFVYAIYDRTTNTVLFMGQVMNPSS